MKTNISIGLLLLITACSSLTQLQKKGSAPSSPFTVSMPFDTLKSVIIVPATIDGREKNFLFDTGAQLSVIQREETKGSKVSVSGASKRSVKMGRESIPSLVIGDAAFKKITALNGDMDGLKQQVDNFGGLIGQSIIQKANWKIDYPKQVITLSNSSLSDSSFQTLLIMRDGGNSPYAYVHIHGQRYKALIDLGSSSSGLNVPLGHPLEQELLSRYTAIERKRSIYTLGGTQEITEKLVEITEVQLGSIAFKEVTADIRKSSELRIGMRFFKDCILVIDNEAGNYKIKR